MLGILFGVIGFVLIYISLIKIAIANNLKKPTIVFVLSFCFMILFGYCGSIVNITRALAHWVLEILNICCQGLLLLGTYLLFSKNNNN